MTTHTRIALALAAAPAAAAATALLLATQASGTAGRTLHLSVTATRISDVDVPPLVSSKTSPETPGDEVLAVSRIGGATSGRRFLVCAATQTAPSIERALYACQVTYVLRGGTITASGVVHLTGTATAAVTGGTGIYVGARGSLVSWPGGDTITLD